MNQTKRNEINTFYLLKPHSFFLLLSIAFKVKREKEIFNLNLLHNFLEIVLYIFFIQLLLPACPCFVMLLLFTFNRTY